MTEKRLQELFTKWQARLGLGLWDIEMRVEPCQEDHSYMEIKRSVSYNNAVISVAPWVLTGAMPEGVVNLTLTDERIETKVVHELLHCSLARMRAIVQERLDGLLHRDVLAVIDETYGDAEENAIENLAQALVRSWGS